MIWYTYMWWNIRAVGVINTFIPLLAVSTLHPTSPQFPHPPNLWQPPFYSVSVSSMLLDSTYKWAHIVFVFLWLISLSLMPSGSTRVVINGRISFCLWLNNIPLHTHIPHFLYSFIHHLSVDTWVISIPWLLWIMLQWTWCADILSR